eukprot:6427639-Amphidinium_carterae.1
MKWLTVRAKRFAAERHQSLQMQCAQSSSFGGRERRTGRAFGECRKTTFGLNSMSKLVLKSTGCKAA